MQVTPLNVLYHQVTRRGHGREQLLIQWSNMPTEDATWEGVISLKTRFPNFQP
jgi:hypothetical protein